VKWGLMRVNGVGKGIGLHWGGTFALANRGDKKDPWVVQRIYLHLEDTHPVGTLGFA
jgi:hypothetical protein